MKDIIIITGGTSGLGLELVKQSIEKGFMVCNIGRNVNKMDELNKQFGESHKGFIGDISDEEFNSSLAIINYRFIRIHPFEDGNGRVSRMLLNYIWNLKNGCVPIGLDNDEINGMIEIYKNIDGLVYSAFMVSYLSNLKYDIDYCLEAEALLTMDIASFLAKNQQEAKIRLGLVSDRIMK